MYKKKSLVQVGSHESCNNDYLIVIILYNVFVGCKNNRFDSSFCYENDHLMDC